MLLSIKPQFVDLIFSGKKKFEYRKKKCKRNVNTIVIYATAPVMRVVGEVIIGDIVEDSLDAVWEKTKEFSGISKDFFDEYYQGKQSAVAYELENLRIYETPLTLEEIGVNSAPQSYCYLDV
jgi:hypothetical protein